MKDFACRSAMMELGEMIGVLPGPKISDHTSIGVDGNSELKSKKSCDQQQNRFFNLYQYHCRISCVRQTIPVILHDVLTSQDSFWNRQVQIEHIVRLRSILLENHSKSFMLKIRILQINL